MGWERKKKVKKIHSLWKRMQLGMHEGRKFRRLRLHAMEPWRTIITLLSNFMRQNYKLMFAEKISEKNVRICRRCVTLSLNVKILEFIVKNNKREREMRSSVKNLLQTTWLFSLYRYILRMYERRFELCSFSKGF